MTRKCPHQPRRGENTNTPAHEPPARTKRRKRTSRGARVVGDLCLSLSGCRSADGIIGGARQVDYRPAHARASSVPDLITRKARESCHWARRTGCSVVSQIAKNNIPSHIIRSGGQPAHNTSHPMPPSCHLSQAPIIVYRCLLISPDTALRYETHPSNRSQTTGMTNPLLCYYSESAQILRVPQDRKEGGQLDSA